jgi:hypothetical protein
MLYSGWVIPTLITTNVQLTKLERAYAVEDSQIDLARNFCCHQEGSGRKKPIRCSFESIATVVDSPLIFAALYSNCGILANCEMLASYLDKFSDILAPNPIGQ